MCSVTCFRTLKLGPTSKHFVRRRPRERACCGSLTLRYGYRTASRPPRRRFDLTLGCPSLSPLLQPLAFCSSHLWAGRRDVTERSVFPCRPPDPGRVAEGQEGRQGVRVDCGRVGWFRGVAAALEADLLAGHELGRRVRAAHPLGAELPDDVQVVDRLSAGVVHGRGDPPGR